jgi:hypothetical protein
VSETPRFERDSAKVTFFSSDLRKGGRRYKGVAKQDIEIQLKKKSD